MKELSAPKQVLEEKADSVKVKLLLASPLHRSPSQPILSLSPMDTAQAGAHTHKGCATQTQLRLGIQNQGWRNRSGKGVFHPTPRSGFKPHPGTSTQQRTAPTEGHTVCHLPADRLGCISTSSQAKFKLRRTQTGVSWAAPLGKV